MSVKHNFYQRLRRLIWFLSLSVGLAIGLWTSSGIQADRSKAESAAIQNSVNLSRAFAEQWADLFEGLEMVFGEIRRAGINSRVFKGSRPAPAGVAVVYLLDVQERLLASSSPLIHEVQDWMRPTQMKLSTACQLRIGEERRLTADGSRFLPVLRPLKNDKGQILGWMGAGLNTEQFQTKFSDVAAWGIIDLVVGTEDGALLIKIPSTEEDGVSFLRAGLRLREENRRLGDGWFYEPAKTSEISQFTAFWRAGSAPLVVVLRRTQDQIFAAWRSASGMRALVAGISLLTIFGLAFMLHRQIRSLEREEAHLRQLQIAARRAQKAEALGRFSAGIAHDFNNILTVLFGQLDRLRGAKLHREANQSVEEIFETTLRARNMVRQVLAIARRPEPGEKPVLPTIEMSGEGRVIFVDDDTAVVELVKDFMALHGIRGDCFASPLKAFDEFKANPLSTRCLVTDIQMSPWSGFELAKKVWELRPELPVLFTTAMELSLEDIGQTLGHTGKNFFLLRKPYHFPDLLEIVRRKELNL